MKQKWLTTQKIIALFLIIWGLSLLSYDIYVWTKTLIIVHISWKEFALIKVLKNNHFVLILFSLSIIAGVLLLLRKKIGWIFSISLSAVIPFEFLISSYFNYSTNAITYLILFSTAIIFWTLCGLLLSKPIRQSINPTKINWIIIIIIFFLLIADGILSNTNSKYQQNQNLKDYNSKSLNKPNEY